MKHLLIFIILFSCSIIDAYSVHNGMSQEKGDTVILNEVVVTAAQELTRIEGDGMVTRIQGTVLQNIGTARDVLGYIPGVLNNNGSIEVFGKGVPIFYINGRPMRNPLELDQLKSYQIKDVKVITNPGARYGSGSNAVVRISTVKNTGEGFALDTRTVGGWCDNFYGKEQVNLNYRTGGLDIFGILHYDWTKVKKSSHSVQNTWLSNHFQSDLVTHSIERQQIFDGQIGFNYVTASGHAFGAYYQGLGKYNRSFDHSDASFLTDEVLYENNKITNNDKTDYYQHLVDAYYSGQWQKWSADITFSYLWRTNKDLQSVSETRKDNRVLEFGFNDRNKGGMLAGEINLSRPLWHGSLDLGASFSDSRRSDVFDNPEGLITNSDNTIKETTVGLYGESMQRLGILTLQVGLRYEHIANRYFEGNVKINDQSRNYNELLPSATIVVPVRKSVFQLSYSRKYSRPFYSQLSSSIIYTNTYLYETGNPSLKSTFTDAVSLTYKLKWLMLSATYKHIINRVITISEAYGDNPEITLLKKINSSRPINNFEFMANVAPGFIGKFYYPMLMGGIIAQSYEIDYRDGVKKMNAPMGIIRFNNIFRLPSNFMVAANLSWRSKGDSDNVTTSQSWQVDIAASKSLNQNWEVRLSFNDIFNTACKSDFTMYSSVRDMKLHKTSSSRSVELAVGYRFNVPKSKYKGKGAGAEEKMRF
ncbi:MAG: outer membrane beta-barrel protein [Bacteroides sp.]|nr:outer membrane beta-barrel protein [Bacteroides sp.]